MREEPAPCRWSLPDPWLADPDYDVVGVGADLAPGTVLQAYRTGLFPMHLQTGELGWWSPNPRGVLPLDMLRVTRSLRQSMKGLSTTIDLNFTGVMRQCRQARPDTIWITDEFIATYTELHRLGWAHSIEVWADGAMVGGLYGIEIGGVFAGESMFHQVRDASKAALVTLVGILQSAGGDRILDVQWCTDHLASLGAIEIGRAEYLEEIDRAQHLPAGFAA